MDHRKEKEKAFGELLRLTAACTEITEKGFAVDLRGDTEAWHNAVLALGARESFRLMSELLCGAYARRYGHEYLFSENCVAFEIAYHANAYFWSQRLKGHARHVTTLLFNREELARHCEVIDISTDDVASLRQRLMFGYAGGVRERLRGTQEDPFDRSSLLKRIAGSRKKRQSGAFPLDGRGGPA